MYYLGSTHQRARNEIVYNEICLTVIIYFQKDIEYFLKIVKILAWISTEENSFFVFSV